MREETRPSYVVACVFEVSARTSGSALSSKRRGTDTHTPTSTPLIPVPVRDDSSTQCRARRTATIQIMKVFQTSHSKTFTLRRVIYMGS